MEGHNSIYTLNIHKESRHSIKKLGQKRDQCSNSGFATECNVTFTVSGLKCAQILDSLPIGKWNLCVCVISLDWPFDFPLSKRLQCT